MFKLGTISQGTMRPQDITEALIYWCADEDITDSEVLAPLYEAAYHALRDPDSGEWHDPITDFYDAVNGHRRMPPFCYMGAHDGDGSDLGIWPMWEDLQHEHPSIVQTVTDLPDFVLLDHGERGNYTLYRATYEPVWSV